jgi:hypothetical protein
MPRNAAFTSLALVLFVVPSSLSAEPPKKAEDYWPLKVGHKWVYQNADHPDAETVVTVAAEKKTDAGTRYTLDWVTTVGMVKTTDREVVLVKPDGVYMAEVYGADLDPPVRNLKLPVKAGDEWTVDTRFGTSTTTYKFKVGKPEKVKVPAGTYDAVRVDWAGSGNSPFSDNKITIPGTKWFADGVGLIRVDVPEGLGKSSLLLKSFTPAK